MFKKGSKLYSIFTGKCPKCHEEIMYTNKNPYILSEALSMNEKCSNCETPISFRYPAVELFTALTSLAIAWHFGFGTRRKAFRQRFLCAARPWFKTGTRADLLDVGYSYTEKWL